MTVPGVPHMGTVANLALVNRFGVTSSAFTYDAIARIDNAIAAFTFVVNCRGR